MKDGTTFKSLVKNPGINKALFVVYIIANIVIAFQLLITMFNYLFAAIAFIVILFIFYKVLGIGAGTAFMSSSNGGCNPKSHKLGAGDGSCDKTVTEDGVTHKLTEDGLGYRDENGGCWTKDGDGVHRF